jgi:small-conductance mechanosensitive channel
MFAPALGDPCADGEQICGRVYDWTGSETLAELSDRAIGVPLALLGLLLFGLLLRWLLYRFVDRLVARAQGGVLPARVGGWTRFRRGRARQQADQALADAVEHERDLATTTRRVQRAKTMGDLLKSVATGVLVAVVGTMMLSEVGVDIAPIIASAGIIGIALGFGAQSLVKDFLSGIFMIVEDQFGVGDVVDVGEATGTVEAVSLRVTRVRDVNGTVWYVPNGEILRVGNMSQNWARAVVDVSVGYGEDLARVKRVLTDVAAGMWEDEEFRDVIIEQPEVTGVEMLAADSVNIRVMVKTAPMEQWAVARELRQRIKARFDHEGIEIPFAQRVVWHREEKRASEPDEADSETPSR